MTREQLNDILRNPAVARRNPELRGGNRDRETPHSTRAEKPKLVAGQAVRATPAEARLGAGYRLSTIGITFHAQHGRKLDPDNLAFVSKLASDACVNLGLAPDDSRIESSVVQRMDDRGIGVST